MDLKCVFVCVLHWIGFFIMHKSAEYLLKIHSSINWLERNIVLIKNFSFVYDLWKRENSKSSGPVVVG